MKMQKRCTKNSNWFLLFLSTEFITGSQVTEPSFVKCIHPPEALSFYFCNTLVPVGVREQAEEEEEKGEEGEVDSCLTFLWN